MTKRSPSQPCGGGCGRMLKQEPRRKTDKCRACYEASTRQPARYCRECGVPIGRESRNPSGLCLTHAMAMPSRRAKISAALRVIHSDPVAFERRVRAIRANKLAHIPIEYRDDYMDLMRRTSMTAAERTEVIRCQMEADQREFLKTGKLPQTSRSKTA